MAPALPDIWLRLGGDNVENMSPVPLFRVPYTLRGSMNGLDVCREKSQKFLVGWRLAPPFFCRRLLVPESCNLGFATGDQSKSHHELAPSMFDIPCWIFDIYCILSPFNSSLRHWTFRFDILFPLPFPFLSVIFLP